MSLWKLALLSVAVTGAACAQPPAAPTPNPARPAPLPWSILVYAAVDNNAEGPLLDFLDKVRLAVDDDPGLDLLLFIDRAEKHSTNKRTLGEDFTGARLYRLKSKTVERLPGSPEFPEITLDRDAELDSADASNLGRFIAWGKRISPARRHALLIYSHANGQSMCPDEQSSRDMGIAELTDEVGAAGHVDFLALELCGMGGIEIAYQWRPVSDADRFSADVLLAIPNAGPPLDWDRAFQRIRSPGHLSDAASPPLDPATMTAADFGRLVIEEGRAGRLASEERGRDCSHEAAACYDLRAAAAVKESVDAWARALAESDSKHHLLPLRARGAAINYSEGGAYVDLFDLARRAAHSDALTPAARAAATKVAAATDAFIIDSFGMSGYPGFTPGQNGVFIVLPTGDSNSWKKSAWYTPNPQSKPDPAGGGDSRGKPYGRWSFLLDGATPNNGKTETWFELLDSWFDQNDGGTDKDGGVNGLKP